MKAKEEAQGGAWDLFRDHFVELWPKVVKLHAPLRVDCNMTVELKKQKSAEASEKLKASFDSESVIPALKAIGIGISAEVAIEASQKFSSTIDKTIADQSFDVNQFIVVTRDGPKLVSFGLGGDCPSPATAATAPMATTEPMLFPYAIVEGIPETAVNRDVVEVHGKECQQESHMEPRKRLSFRDMLS